MSLFQLVLHCWAGIPKPQRLPNDSACSPSPGMFFVSGDGYRLATGPEAMLGSENKNYYGGVYGKGI